MLESWILFALDPSRQDLPIFKTKTQTSAQQFYSGRVPDQLGDLCDIARKSKPRGEFFLEVASSLDVDLVGKASPSFKLFCEQLANW